MNRADLLAELDRQLVTADASARVSWLVALTSRVTQIGALIGQQEDCEWTPLEAGQYVGVSSDRIKAWARRPSAKVWAHRLTRKCLRVRKGPFLSWHGVHERESKPTQLGNGMNERESASIAAPMAAKGT